MPFGPATASKSIFGFDPRSIARCALWLDAADPSTLTLTPGTTTITAWRDKSPLCASFTATNSPTLVANQVNGNPAIYLNSVNKPYFTGTLTNTNNVVSVFCVAILSSVSLDPPTSYSRLFSATSAGNTNDAAAGNIFIGRYGISSQIYATTSTGANLPNTVSDFPTVTANSPFLYSFHGLNRFAVSYRFGTTVLSTQISGTTNYSYTQLDIGRSRSSSTNLFWDGYACEFLVYNSVLTDQQRQQVEGYLAWKWGLMGRLPLSHPFSTRKVYARTFLPSDINGCVAWFDAADTTTVNTSGTTVVRWKDKSGNGNDGIPGTGPTYVTDSSSRPCLNFNGTSQTLVSNARVPTHTHCLIAVWNPTTITDNTKGNSSLFRFQGTTGYIVFPYMNGTTPRGYITNFDGASLLAGASTLVENSVAEATNACIANIGPTRQEIYKNGTLQSSASGTMATFTTSDTLIIGSFGTTSEFFNGKLYEMIIYDTQLNTTQRQMIEAYLAFKWGLVTSLNLFNPFVAITPSVPVPFVPTNIPNCALWLDGADTSPTSMTFGAGTFNVSSWLDKSGNGRTATGFNTPRYVPSSINGIGSILLNNSPYFTGALTISGEMVTCIAVATNFDMGSVVTSNSRLVSLAASGQADWNTPRNVTAIYATTSSSTINSYRNNAIIASNTVAASTPFIASVQYDGDVGRLFINGSEANATGRSSVGFFNTTNYAIGNQVDLGGNLWNGYVGEVIVYSTVLSDIEREYVEGYLARKWSIHISDSGAFSRQVPSNFPSLNIADISGAILNLDLAFYTNTESETIPYVGNRWGAFPNTSSATRPTRVTTPGGSFAVQYNGTDQFLFDTYSFANPGAYTVEVTFLADPIYAITNSPLQAANIVAEWQPTTGYVYTVAQVRDGFVRIGPYNYSTAGLVLSKVVPNRWVHLVLTNSAGASTTNTTSTLSGYINGVLVNTAVFTRYAPTTSYYGLARNGNPNGSTYFKGQTGYLRIYGSVLTATQIRQNYNTICERYGLPLLTTSLPVPVFSLDARVNYYNNYWDTTQMFNYTTSGYSDLSGGRITFSGSSQYGEAPDGYASWPQYTMFVVCNFNPTAGNYERVFDFGWGGPGDNILFCRNATSTTTWLFEIWKNTSRAIQITGTIKSGNACYAITLQFGAVSGGFTWTTGTVYINGVQTASALYGPGDQLPNLATRTNNYIGRSGWGSPSPDAWFTGSISLIQMYNVALTATQITTIYNQYKTRFNLP